MWSPNIYTWDAHAINDVTNYEAMFEGDVFYTQGQGSLEEHERSNNPPVMANKNQRGKTLRVRILSRSSSTDFSDAYNQLNGWFDTFDDVERVLVVKDASNVQWYVYATPVDTPRVMPDGYIVDLKVLDPIWRKVTAVTDTWSITASGQTHAVTVAGNRPLKPKIRIKAMNAKTGGYGYKAVRVWRNPITDEPNPYPLDVLNNAWDMATLVSASKAQADGDDVAIFPVDGGAPLPRWLAGANTSTAQAWVNNYFEPGVALTLGADIASTGSLATVSVTANGDNKTKLQKLAKLVPFYFSIGTEVLICTSVDSIKFQLNYSGTDMRSQLTSSKAAHTTGDAIYLVKGFWVAYGNASAAAPVQDETQKPLIDMDNSTNAAWKWLIFYDSANLRTAGWKPKIEQGRKSIVYGGSHAAAADPFTEMGMSGYSYDIGGAPRADTYKVRWTFYHPATSTGMTCNGSVYRSSTDFASVAGLWRGNALNAMVPVFNEATPASAATWDDWTQTVTYTAAKYLQFRFDGNVKASSIHHCEVQTITSITLDSAKIPQLVFSGAEVASYEFGSAAEGKRARLTNNTTGEYIEFAALVDVDQFIEIDCEAETVTYLKDNSRIDAALDYPARNHVLTIDPRLGANTFQFDDDGTDTVTIEFVTADRNT